MSENRQKAAFRHYLRKFIAGPKCNYSPCAHAQYCLGKIPHSYATAQFADRRCRLEP